MKNVMIDLETLGVVPGSIIFEIGAVFFDPDTSSLGESIRMPIAVLSQCYLGMSSNQETLKWWENQPKEYRTAFDYAMNEGGIDIREAMKIFDEFLNTYGTIDELKVWGNDPSFDNAFLAVAYQRLGMKPSWKFWNNRCLRTLRALNPGDNLPRVAVTHSALEDAIQEAKDAIVILGRLKQAQLKYKGPRYFVYGYFLKIKEWVLKWKKINFAMWKK